MSQDELSAGRRVDLDLDLDPQPFVGRREAAEILGVNRTSLGRLIDLPEPFQKLKAGPIWWAQDIRDFKARMDASDQRYHSRSGGFHALGREIADVPTPRGGGAWKPKPKRGRPKGQLSPRSRAIRHCVLSELVDEYDVMTVRQVFYALTSAE